MPPGYLVDQATLDHDLQHYLGADGDPTASSCFTRARGGCERSAADLYSYRRIRSVARRRRGICGRLREAGIQTTYTCHSGMIHLFYGLGRLIPYAATAYQLIGTDIRTFLGGTP